MMYSFFSFLPEGEATKCCGPSVGLHKLAYGEAGRQRKNLIRTSDFSLDAAGGTHGRRVVWPGALAARKMVNGKKPLHQADLRRKAEEKAQVGRGGA